MGDEGGPTGPKGLTCSFVVCLTLSGTSTPSTTRRGRRLDAGKWARFRGERRNKCSPGSESAPSSRATSRDGGARGFAASSSHMLGRRAVGQAEPHVRGGTVNIQLSPWQAAWKRRDELGGQHPRPEYHGPQEFCDAMREIHGHAALAREGL